MSKSKGKKERAAGAVAKAADVQGSSPNVVEDEQVASQTATAELPPIDAADLAFEQETSVAQNGDVQGLSRSDVSAEGQLAPTADVLDSTEKVNAAMDAVLNAKLSAETVQDADSGEAVEVAKDEEVVHEVPQVEAAAPTVASPLSDLQARIAKLQEQLTALSTAPPQLSSAAPAAAAAAKKSGPGSKPRPNVTYFLLKKPAAWASTPQRAQIEQILFSPEVQERFKKDDGQVTLTEPEFFEVIEAGAAAGLLRTTQPAVRVAMYYYNDLLNAGCIRRQ
jgi:hypothetical protein